MELSLLLLVCCGLGGLGVPRVPAAPAEGRAPPPSAVAAAVSGDGVLTCDVTPPVRGLQVEMLEWYHVSGGSERTAYVHRRNEDMRKDIADEFRGRTELGEDGSLKIRHLTPNDSGQYRCVVWRRSRAEASVSLRVFQVERLDVGVSRTADNQLLILCETRVQNLPPKPLPLMPLKLSLLDAGGKPLPLLDAGGKPLPLLDAGGKPLPLLDADGKPLPLVPGSWVDADQVHSVRARFPPRGPPEGGTFTCRLQVPELDLVEDRRIRIADQFSPQAGPGLLSWTLVVSILLAVLVPVATVLGFKLGCNKGWQSNLEEFFRKTFKLGSGQAGSEDQRAHVDLKQVETTGASEVTARLDHGDPGSGVPLSGVGLSKKLAEEDLDRMCKYKVIIRSVGSSLKVDPALIAAIISKQSQAGRSLRPSGDGNFDQNCFGLMQINKNFHHVTEKGGPCSFEHIQSGTTHLVHLLKTVRIQRSDWSGADQLKGGLVAYISGIDKVLPASAEELDALTPTRDFSNDVIARARWYAENKKFTE